MSRPTTASTGKLAWRFYTVPGDPSKGPDDVASDPIMARAAATWNGQWWKVGGGGTVWDAIVYDPEFKQLIVGVGNGSPWNQQHRSPGGGDNLFLASMVALDAATGAYKWHYQTTPGETWDYTATQPIVLADLQIDGKARKVAMQAPKNGFFYVVDRENGRLISARPFVPMSQAKDTPAGMPISWAYDVDVATGRPVENPEARYRGKPALVRPGPSGAHNWHPMSYSPETGLVYLPAQDNALGYAHDPALDVREGFDNIGVAIDPLPDDEAVRAAIRSASKGMLLAWDPVAQRQVWRSDRTGPWNGGTLATAGGLVFQGTGDGQFLALDAKTGKTLWSADNQAATLAGPISFAVGDEQYVAVTAGYGGSFFLIDSFLGPAQGNPLNGRVLRIQARRHGAEAGAALPTRADAKASAARRKGGCLCARRATLRAQLHRVPRRGGVERRRPARPAPIGSPPGCRRVPPRGGRRRIGAARHAALREVRVGGGRGADSRLRRQAGVDGLRGGTAQRDRVIALSRPCRPCVFSGVVPAAVDVPAGRADRRGPLWGQRDSS